MPLLALPRLGYVAGLALTYRPRALRRRYLPPCLRAKEEGKVHD